MLDQLKNVSEEQLSVSGIPIRTYPTHGYRTALGLDFGLHCGMAYSVYSEAQSCWYILPQWIFCVDLNTSRYESKSTCFLRLLDFLNTINPQIIFYELVRFTPAEFIKEKTACNAYILARAATSMELLVALRQTVLLWAEDHNVPFVGIPIQTIKKVATGSGRASKKDIIKKCNEMFKTNFDLDAQHVDNAADAAFVLFAGLQSFEAKI